MPWHRVGIPSRIVAVAAAATLAASLFVAPARGATTAREKTAAPSPVVAGEPRTIEAIVNAPVATVWEAFTTPAAYTRYGVPDARIDLRLGGLLVSGRAVSEIAGFEKERLLVLKARESRDGNPAPGTLANAYQILYFTALGSDMTQVRIAGFGFADPAAASLFAADAAAHLQRLEKEYWPLCELCKKEGGT